MMSEVFERVNIFGNVDGTNPKDIRNFQQATNHQYGGSYPDCQKDYSDDEVIRQTRNLLIAGGILEYSPITPCSTSEEKVTQILKDCVLRRSQNGPGLYWIIDNNPQSFWETIKSLGNFDQAQRDILNSTTLIALRPKYAFDYVDHTTGLRIVSLPTTFHFPTHPTLAS